MKERETKRPEYCRTMKKNTDKKKAKKSESTERERDGETKVLWNNEKKY